MVLIFESNTSTICTCHLTRYVQRYTILSLNQARNQLGTPGGAKCLPRRAKIF